MSLDIYRAKRDFTATPEPADTETEPPAEQLRFVVQKHVSSRLHYDFRLELDGVLISWAIPKGPSLNPKDRRLSMRVEDHVLAYRHFEGVIPTGQYGAGTVMVWDSGTYYVNPALSREENEELVKKGLGQGKLTFFLEGEKLKGDFTLVQVASQKPAMQKNAWLLIKHRDAYTSEADILDQDISVLTHRTIDAIARDAGTTAPQPTEQKLPLGDMPQPETVTLDRDIQIWLRTLGEQYRGPMPTQIKPMLATLVDEPFENPDWFFEIKWDGYRALAEIDHHQVQFYSRNQKPYDDRFPLIFNALRTIPYRMVLDGEIVGLDAKGQPDFNMVKNYQANQDALVYMVFDLLYLEGYDLRACPLMLRKHLLKKILPTHSRIRYSDHVEGDGAAFYELALNHHLEGIIAKEADSPYLTDQRSNHWLKIKTVKIQEAIIVGYTAPRKSRKYLGSLLLGVHNDYGELIYIGHTGTGMDDETRRNLKQQLDQIRIAYCPFFDVPKTNAPAIWVKPQLVCEVKFQQWTPDNRLRMPVFMGLRHDKGPEEVLREHPRNTRAVIEEEAQTVDVQMQEEPPTMARRYFGPQTPERPAKKAPTGKTIAVDNTTVTITHPDKILFPRSRYTKWDLAQYYLQVAPAMLPYLIDRPLVLHRFPNGVDKPGFYQKNYPDALPDWVERVAIYTESEGADIHYVICQNKATLLYLANLGCIEINPWNARVEQPDYPDYLVIDLDPYLIDFDKVIQTALVFKHLLDTLGAPSYVKTTGLSGLHIFIPLKLQYSFDTVRQFARLLFTLVHQETPEWTSLDRTPARRKKKVYLDYAQNRIGQPMVAPYSVRPNPLATVSTPLRWDEVNRDLDPARWTIDNVPERVRKLGDVWESMSEKSIDLQDCFAQLQRIFPELSRDISWH